VWFAAGQMQAPGSEEAKMLEKSHAVSVQCPLTIGGMQQLTSSQRFCWYPFWFLCTFVMDTAEDLDEKLSPFLDSQEVEAEIHGLCCHALEVLGCGCLSTYR
jgi:hypothetical protein